MIDLNLIGVKDADINISRCTFDNNFAKKANIKIAARGGPSDADASDIPHDIDPATIKSVIISECNFINSSEDFVDLNIGTTSKSGPDAINISGDYVVTIENNTSSVKVSQPFNEFEVTVPSSEVWNKFVGTNIGKVVSVADYDMLFSASSDVNVSKIELQSSIDVTDTITVSHPCIIEGNNKTLSRATVGQILVCLADATIQHLSVISSADNVSWHSGYDLQLYGAKFNVSDVKLSGNNAGMLVNGANVSLSGNINVSDNTFGGIEVSKGEAPGVSPSVLNINDAVISNLTEEYSKPTIWIDGLTEDIGVVNGGSFTRIQLNDQYQYYIKSENSVPAE